MDGFVTPPSVTSGRCSPHLFVKKDPSPANLHSLLHGEIISPHVTPESYKRNLSRSTPPSKMVCDDDTSPELLTGSSRTDADRVSPRRSNRVARSLNYIEEEDDKQNENSDIFYSTPVKVVSSGLCTPQKSILKTPDRRSQTPKKSVTFLHGVDPLESDSASMVAFALSTPTKEDPLSFTGVL